MKNLIAVIWMMVLLPATFLCQTAEEWTEQAEVAEAQAKAAEEAAEKAEAQGNDRKAANKRLEAQEAWRTAGTARASAAEKQVEDEEYKKAAENYEKAGDHFEKAGNPGQAAAERKKASSNYKTAADNALASGDEAESERLKKRAETLEDEEAMAESKAAPERALDAVISTAKGTGRTTGHIANLSVKNKTDRALRVIPQTFYIPSRGGHQSYVGRIPPGHVIPPGESIDIPVNGYCTDVSKPPVPVGGSMPPLVDWVPVSGQDFTIKDDEVQVIPGPTQSPFDPDDIGDLTSNPGFQSGDPTADEVYRDQSSELSQEYVPTWPGTDQVIEGTIDISEDIDAFGPVIVSIVEQIEGAAVQIIQSGNFSTPLAGDPVRELEAIIQQTVWYVVGLVTGQLYTLDEFEENVEEEFQLNTGTSVGDLPEEEQERFSSDVQRFWNTFTATGVEAKVLNIQGGTGEEPESVIFGDYDDVKDRDDFDVWRRTKYDKYVLERKLNGKSHEEACKKVDIDPDEDLAKAFKRVYEKK